MGGGASKEAECRDLFMENMNRPSLFVGVSQDMVMTFLFTLPLSELTGRGILLLLVLCSTAPAMVASLGPVAPSCSAVDNDEDELLLTVERKHTGLGYSNLLNSFPVLRWTHSL